MKNKIIVCFVAVLIIISHTNAQIKLNGKFSNIPSSIIGKISIEYWSGDNWLEMDTMGLGADKSFQKNISRKHVQVRLRVWGQNTKWIDFIVPLTPSHDSVLDFGTIDYRFMAGGPAKISGTENEDYFNLLSIYQKCRLLKDSISKADPSDFIRLNMQLEKTRALLNDRCNEISMKKKGTFTGDIVANLLYFPVKSDYSYDNKITQLSKEDFEREHLIDRIPFGDKRVLLHNAFIKALNNYSSKFPKTDSVYCQLFIDRLMSQRRGNEEVDTWLFHFLLLKFVNSQDDISLTYLLKWYSSDCSENETSADETTKTLMTALRNCEVGKKAFALSLPDSLGNNINPENIAIKNKITLLFFWRSDCSHCKEFEPELAKIYLKYKPLGLEIIGVSLDNNEMNWRKYLRSNHMDWVNLHPITNKQRRQIDQNFPIPGTPALIAVDKHFIVKNRLVIRNTLEKYLSEELGK